MPCFWGLQPKANIYCAGIYSATGGSASDGATQLVWCLRLYLRCALCTVPCAKKKPPVSGRLLWYAEFI